MGFDLVVPEMDVFFLSYDEPRKEEFWSDLLAKVEWADRVDGVTGFDAAHKECAKRTTTNRFFTVDADSTVDDQFFYKTLKNIPDRYHDHVFSWRSRNVVNNLVYGNGGVKCWPRSVVENMQTHEASPDEGKTGSKVDFCWDLKYTQVIDCISTTYPNGSPKQAFRSGFREGVKMALNKGTQTDPAEYRKRIWSGNLKRLGIWCSVGADVENGLWCILGARYGVRACMDKNWDFTKINDYQWFNELWDNEIAPRYEGDTHKCTRTQYEWDEDTVIADIREYEEYINSRTGLNVALLSENQSRFFKEHSMLDKLNSSNSYSFEVEDG